MIGFLQPLALLGLTAAAIPPLLYLLGRRRPPTVVFPAIQYLTATEREHSRRLKLRNLLLLLLRVAAIVLIVLAAARPVAHVQAGTSHPPTALAIVVDNSLSAGAVVAGQTVLATLATRARDVLERSEAGDQLWLVLADGELRSVTRATAHITLDSLTPWPVRLDLGTAVRAAARGVRESELGLGEVVVLSDLQASALSSGPPVEGRVLVLEAPS
ncbi:MAG: BatA domain-containing protein, partial [Gemmatimonadota bacterium]|nr:BatA domain-containing protein [Gemmatimonadota bacterium]